MDDPWAPIANERDRGYPQCWAVGARVKASANAKALITSHLRDDGSAGAFNRNLGSAYTGESLGGCGLLMRIDISPDRSLA